MSRLFATGKNRGEGYACIAWCVETLTVECWDVCARPRKLKEGRRRRLLVATTVDIFGQAASIDPLCALPLPLGLHGWANTQLTSSLRTALCGHGARG